VLWEEEPKLLHISEQQQKYIQFGVGKLDYTKATILELNFTCTNGL
jgi:hypothetical protein